ncbi:MAG TPA: 3-oxoacyl-[acyl-carrier-protein] reductase [Candidatus Egerieimonas intestinavium]|uniref:3-oxoacyl-[acyl-carrier-protein] reductase n=1 Tax=Candidatus Egerieimonas intestinavium TaxID=2840777 RepID=A0A9D1ELD8_9FIRM|nr:3-oxoacyl-[acyl-carrier-protein] reductase [Candidatus Egerieimonas intestinavium]
MNRRVALVTGASRGIGRAIAKRLAQDGIFVIVNYCGSKEKAEAVLEEIKAQGGDGVCAQADVSDFAAAETLMKELVKEYGRIDILVNNAGITRDGLLMKMSEEDFDRVLDVNLKGCFNTIRHLSRQFLKQRYGRIINIASVVGVIGNAGQANYSASKAGIIGLTKSVARELASRGVTANAVAPGFIETEMTAVLPDKIKEQMAGQIPLGTFGKPEDVAEAVAFLASDSARYITGQVLNVNGGMAM